MRPDGHRDRVGRGPLVGDVLGALLVRTAAVWLVIASLLVVEAQDLIAGGETEHSLLLMAAVALPVALGLTGLSVLVRRSAARPDRMPRWTRSGSSTGVLALISVGPRCHHQCMAVGQAPLVAVLDVAALGQVEARIEAAVWDRSAAHGRRLRDVLALHRVFCAAGAGLATVAHVALLEQTSELAAGALLCQAQVLSSLPEALDAVDCGLLTVDQAAVLGRALAPLHDVVQLAVWERVRARLLAGLEQGLVLSPARLKELLAGWVIAAAPQDAVDRRETAEAAGSVDYRRRDDGLVDLFASGLNGPNAQAVLSRIRDRARPWGGDDDRSAGKRRLDALVDLLLGRDQLPLGPVDSEDPFHQPEVHCRPGCGCRLGEPVPCGMDVSLLIPLGAALGTTDEPAVLQGHGPVEPDLLQAALHNAPRIRPVWVDEDGVPVAVGDAVECPPRGDPQAVRDALLRLATAPPGALQPRHPDDHPPPVSGRTHDLDGAGPDSGDGVATPSRGESTGDVLGLAMLGVVPDDRRRPALRMQSHPVDTPGAYRVPTRLARVVRVRAPRCEWPGCGHRAAGCDLDHDLAWPAGPTCACNLGPLCRRHHRLKQLLLAKARGERSAVRWTSPTGRTWTSPSQHTVPPRPCRPLPPVMARHEDEPPADDDLYDLDECSPDPADARLCREDVVDIDDEAALVERLGDGWGLALEDHTRWE